MRKRNVLIKILSGIVVFVFITGFWGARGDSVVEKRRAIQEMCKSTLADLYRLRPAARKEIKNARGYAVFSNVGIKLFLLSTANGYGLAHDNRSGKEFYMKMLSGGLGLGMGIKEFRGIFIFDSDNAFEEFVEHGWTAGGQAEAAARLDDQGQVVALAVEIAPGIRLYQLTKNGLAAQITVQGTRYWKDDALN